MQTSNDLLKNILFVLGKIEAKQGDQKGEKEAKAEKSEGTKQIVNIATALASFDGVKEKSRKAFIDFSRQLVEITEKGRSRVLDSFAESLVKLSQALPALSEGLNSLAGGAIWGRTTRALNVLQRLFDLMVDLGSNEGSAKVERAITLFDKLGKSLDRLAGPMRSLALFMAYLGLAFIVFAGGMLLASVILGSTNPLWGLTVLVGTIAVLILVFMGISRLSGLVGPGIKTTQNMGKAFVYLVLGIMAFFVGMLLISVMLGAAGGAAGIGQSMLLMIAIVGIVVLIFMAIGFLGSYVQPGIDIIRGIGLGFLYLIAGLFLFAFGLLAVAALLGEKPNTKGILAAGLIMISVIVVLVGMFWLLGAADKSGNITKGTNAIKSMGLGLFILILAVFIFALGIVGIAAMLGENPNAKGIGLAMLIMAGVVVGITVLFRILGDDKVAGTVAKGAGIAILISIALIMFAISMMFLAEAAARLAALMKTGSGEMGLTILGYKVPDGITALGIIGVIFLASAVAFGILGIPVISAAVALGAAVAILMSVALITFALSVMLLVKASENIPSDLAGRISTMISGVLKGLLDGISSLTEGATGIKGLVNFAKNSVKIFAATAILIAASIALSMFALALTAFARLDSMRPIIGTDRDGKPIFGEQINITKVSQNIATSISGFIKALIDSTDGLSRKQAKGLKRMGDVLTGKDGLLSAVNQFAMVLQTFAQFGEANEIGYLYTDENGEQKRGSVKATVVAKNIIDAFIVFVNELTTQGAEFELSRSEGRKMRRLGYTLMGDPEDSDNPGLLSPLFKFAELLKMFTGAGNNMISFLDEKGEKQSINPAEAAKVLLGGITAFVNAIASTKFDESAVQKFGSLMAKLSNVDKMIPRLTKVSTGLTKLSESLDKLTKSMQTFVKKGEADKYIKYLKDISETEIRIAEAKARSESIIAGKQREEEIAYRKKLIEEKVSEINASKNTVKEVNLSKQSLEELSDIIAKQLVEEMRNGTYTYKFVPQGGGSEGVVIFNK